MIISRTPVRLSFLGGGLDYPQWSGKYGGMVVGGAIRYYSYLTVRRLPRFHSYSNRVVYSQVEEVGAYEEIQHRAIKESLLYANGPDGPGLEIFHAGDLPGRSGLGTSSSFVVGLLNTLAALNGQRWTPEDLADGAIDVERNRMGETVGSQDQVFAAYGGLNRLRFHHSGEISVEPLILGQARLEDLEKNILLIFTGLQRTSSQIASTYVPSLDEKRAQMFGLAKMVEEGVYAIEDGNWKRLGQLMDASWKVKASLSDSVAPPEVHAAYATAVTCGAYGGKLTGAGGGGCLALVAPPDAHEYITSMIAKQVPALSPIHIPVRFDFSGSQIIYSRGN